MVKFFGGSEENSKKQMILLGIIGAAAVAVVILLSGVLKPPPPPPEPEEPKLVYEAELMNTIRFKLHEVKDRGDALTLADCNSPELAKKDATTTGRFIEVTVAVENIGKDNLRINSWDIKELYDKDGAKFYSLPFYNYWTSKNSQCGDLLKPKFTPTLCSKIYDVSKVSTGLKLEVYLRDNKKQTFIDLGI